MNKFCLIVLVLILFVIPLKSTFMTIGFHYQNGKTLSDEWNITREDTTSIYEWDPKFQGYFIQLLYKVSKFHFGLEFGHSQFYFIQAYGTSAYYSQPYPIREDYNPDRLLAVLQYNLYNNFNIQFGAGMHFEEPRLGYMVSLRNHIKIFEFLEIPLFLRGDMVSKRGTPIAISIGTGIVIRWKSGL